MKKAILFFILISTLFFQKTTAQTQTLDEADEKNYDVGVISVSLIMPDKVAGFSASHLSKLENKILKMLTSNGLSGNGYNANFVVYPKIEIIGIDEMSGMETMTSIEVDLNLFVKQLDNNMMFSSFSKSVKGIAKGKSRAIGNAIKKLPTRSKEVKDFLAETKGRITYYYEQKCDDIILEASRYSQSRQYEKALSTLMTIPSEIGECHNKAQEKAIEYYKAYSDQKCTEYLQKASAAEANQNYKMALKYLSLINPTGNCLQKSQEMIQRISTKVDSKEKRNWDFLMKRYDDKQVLRKSRLEAITEISKAYYNRTQPTINLTYKSLF